MVFWNGTQAQLASRRGGKAAATAKQTSPAASAHDTQAVSKQTDAACGSKCQATKAPDADAQALEPQPRLAEYGCRPMSTKHEVLRKQNQDQSSQNCEDGDCTRAVGAVVQAKPDSSKAAWTEGAVVEGKSDSRKAARADGAVVQSDSMQAADDLVASTDVVSIETGLSGITSMSEERSAADQSAGADAAVQKRLEPVPAALTGKDSKLLATSCVYDKSLDSTSIKQRGDENCAIPTPNVKMCRDELRCLSMASANTESVVADWAIQDGHHCVSSTVWPWFLCTSSKRVLCMQG